MAIIVWDADGTRLFEAGCDHGVVYPRSTDGSYTNGVAWNGLTNVTMSPDGAEANDMWADNFKYGSLRSTETAGGTINAYTYPDEIALLDGQVELAPGAYIGQQARGTFGFCYRTMIGNDVDALDHGYKINLVYGASLNPSEKEFGTINDSPEAVEFSWEFTTVPVSVTNAKATATLVLDSTKVDADKMKQIENLLYGTAEAEPRLPLPDEVRTILAGDKSF